MGSENIKKGDIIQVLNNGLGKELKKDRPALVINYFSNPLRFAIVAPITDVTKPKMWHIKIRPTKKNGLSKVSYIDTLQMKSIDLDQRTMKHIGICEERIYHDAVNMCKLVLDM